MELGNNAYFWQKLDTLYLLSDLIINQPKGSAYPRNNQLIYPVDYGYLKSGDNQQIKTYRGSISTSQVDAIVVCADILGRDLEVKLLIGCTEQETEFILSFLNQTDFQKAIIIRRGSSVPDWAESN